MPSRAFITKETGILILVVGQTGVGKSHFINTVAGDTVAPVRDPETPLVKHFVVNNPRVPNLPLIFVEAPGLDHPSTSNDEIWNITLDWLENSCMSDALFGGMIYLHDITQDTLAASEQYGSSWPVRLFGNPYPTDHVFLTTSKWDIVQPDIDYNCREKELVFGVWSLVLGFGACGHLGRFMNTTESAWQVIDTVLKIEPLKLFEFCQELAGKVRLRPAMAISSPRKEKKGIVSRLFNRLAR